MLESYLMSAQIQEFYVITIYQQESPTCLATYFRQQFALAISTVFIT